MNRTRKVPTQFPCAMYAKPLKQAYKRINSIQNFFIYSRLNPNFILNKVNENLNSEE